MKFLKVLTILAAMSCYSQSENNNAITEVSELSHQNNDFAFGEFSGFLNNLYSKNVNEIEIKYEKPEDYYDGERLNSVLQFKYYDEVFVRKIVRPNIYTINPDHEYFYMYYYKIFGSAGNPINLRVLEKDSNGLFWEYYVGKHQVEYLMQENNLFLSKVNGITPNNSELYSFTKTYGDANTMEGSYQTLLTKDDTQLIHQDYSPVMLIIKKIENTNGRFVLTFSDPSDFAVFDGSLLIETINERDYFSDLRAIHMEFREKPKDSKIIFAVYPGNERIIGVWQSEYNEWLNKWNENGRKGSPLDNVYEGYMKNWGESSSIFVDATENHFNVKLQQRDVDAIWSGYFDSEWNR